MSMPLAKVKIVSRIVSSAYLVNCKSWKCEQEFSHASFVFKAANNSAGKK